MRFCEDSGDAAVNWGQEGVGYFSKLARPPHNSLVLSDALSCLSPCQVFARLSANESVILEAEEHGGGDQKSEGSEAAKDATDHEVPASLDRACIDGMVSTLQSAKHVSV